MRRTITALITLTVLSGLMVVATLAPRLMRSATKPPASCDNDRHDAITKDAQYRRRRKTVLKNTRRLAFVVMLMAGLLIALSVPAHAASDQLSGRAFVDTAGACPAPPAGYDDFPPIVMTGSLTGCWYTNILTSRQISSGVYLETGQELFVGSLNGGAAGTFGTTYRFESKFDPDAATGTEIRGRCQHPIVAGSGTGGFAAATGRVDFKDIIGDPVTYEYRGHISLR